MTGLAKCNTGDRKGEIEGAKKCLQESLRKQNASHHFNCITGATPGAQVAAAPWISYPRFWFTRAAQGPLLTLPPDRGQELCSVEPLPGPALINKTQLLTIPS